MLVLTNCGSQISEFSFSETLIYTWLLCMAVTKERKIHAFPEGEFQTLSHSQLLHKLSPHSYLPVWPFPSCDPITRYGAQRAPFTLQRHSGYPSRPPTVSRTYRKKESQYQGQLADCKSWARVEEREWSGDFTRKHFQDANSQRAAFRIRYP